MKELVGILIGIIATIGCTQAIEIYKTQIASIKNGIETEDLQINTTKNFETETQIMTYISQIGDEERRKIEQICSEIKK